MLIRPHALSLVNGRPCSPYLFAFDRIATSHTSYCGSIRAWISTSYPLRTLSENASIPKSFGAMYELIEDIEPFERYTAGGYFPVRIGDRFSSNRYHVVHKLGFGKSSTTWLARDEQLKKYVAIKFAISQLDRPFESAILRALRDGGGCFAKAHAGFAMIPELLDEFQVEGPEIQSTRRKHNCLVTTPARMSISEARDVSHSRLFRLSVARAIVAQLIQAVAFIHSRGIVHGDLHEANILFRLPSSIDELTPDQLYAKYGRPELENIIRLDGEPLDPWVPSHGVVPIWFGDDSDTVSLADARIFLTDFSESFRPAVDIRQSSRAPFVLRPPEILLEQTSQISFASEIWSLACAIFAIMGQRPLFETWFPDANRILEEHVDTLGRLPREWWAIWADCHQYFNDQLQRIDGSPRRPLEDRLEDSIQEPRKQSDMAEMDEEEKQAFLLLLRLMLSFNPDDRPSAQQVLKSDWIHKWAGPAAELIQN